MSSRRDTLRSLFHDHWVLVPILTAGLAQRLFFLWKFPETWFCSDEANLGLMAIRLIRDGTLNIFIAGEAYGGFLGVAVIAIFTLFVGPFWGLKLAALLFFLLFGITLYALGTLVLGRRVALIALLLVSVAPNFLATVGVRERGPHGEALFLGCALMLCTVIATRPSRYPKLVLFIWGFLAGFCWYTYYLLVVFIAPCGIYLAIRLLQQEKPRRLLLLSSVVASGLLAGSAPYWLFVMRHGFFPPFHTAAAGSDPVTGFRNFFLVGLPIITGGRWAFHSNDLVPFLSKLSFFFYLAAALLWLAALVTRKEWLKGPRLLIGLHLLLYPVIFSYSSFYWFAEDPRYLIGLYASLPLAAAWLVSRIHGGSKVLAAATVGGLLFTSLWGTWTLPSTVFSTIFDEPNDRLVRYLKEERLNHFYANYWITYRMMFEAVKDIHEPFPLIGATYFSVTRPRYPEFERAVQEHPDPAFVAWESEAKEFEEQLTRTGRDFRKEVIGRYVVFSEIEPSLEISDPAGSGPQHPDGEDLRGPGTSATE